MRAGIYEIVNLKNQKRYLGSTTDFSQRWAVHKSYLNKGEHHNRHLQSAWNKYGKDAFAFRRVLICSTAHLRFYEQRCLDNLRSEYNASCNASGFPVGNQFASGYRHSPEAIAKISAAAKCKRPPRSDEHRAKLAASSRGSRRHVTPHSEESKKKMSLAKIGKPWSEARRAAQERRA